MARAGVEEKSDPCGRDGGAPGRGGPTGSCGLRGPEGDGGPLTKRGACGPRPATRAPATEAPHHARSCAEPERKKDKVGETPSRSPLRKASTPLMVEMAECGKRSSSRSAGTPAWLMVTQIGGIHGRLRESAP